MWTKKTIQFFVVISIVIAFAVPSALAGGAGGQGDPIAWYFWEAGLLAKDDNVKGSKVTGRVTSIKPAGEITDTCIDAYNAYLYIIVEVNIGKQTELYFYDQVDNNGDDGSGFCAVNYEPQILKLDSLLQADIGPFSWNSVKTVSWNDDPTEGDVWEIFNFSIIVPFTE